jgi:TPR repeat protein
MSSMVRHGWRLRTILRIFPMMVVLSVVGLGQNQPESPVFKRYKAPDEIPLLKYNDPTYQIWQAFLTARKANAGDPLAQHELGIRYLSGLGVERDTVKAAYWIEKAAAQNLLPARFNYAILKYQGWGTPWDPFEAYRNFLYCAERNVLEAQFAVALAHVENLVVPEDWQQGYVWLKRASDAGFKPATNVLPMFEQRLAAQKSPRAPDSPVTQPLVISLQADGGMDTLASVQEKSLLKSAILQADPELRKSLGLSRMIDSTAAIDSVTLTSIRRSADVGSPEALTLLGRLYQEGIIVGQDNILAAAYYLRGFRMDSQRAGKLLWEMGQSQDFIGRVKTSAEAGDSVAQFVWAGLFTMGMDASLLGAKAYITKQQAAHLLRKAADRRFVPAMIELALWYYGGRWIAADAQQATAYLQEAAAAGSREAEIRLATLEVREEPGWPQMDTLLTILSRGKEDGSLLAEVALGFVFETGLGVQKSFSSAGRIYRSAWGRGSQDAYRALRRMHDEIRPSDGQFAMHD